MRTPVHSIEYGQHTIDYTVVRRERATLEIAVEPDMSVVVAVPKDTPLDVIAEKMKKRAAWVRRQQRFFDQYIPRTPERLFVPGETHLYLGRQYRLKVELHLQQRVKLKRGFIVVHSHKPKRNDVTKELVEAWYRERAHAKFTERLEISQERFPNPAKFTPKGVIIRDLRRRWGSMSPASRLMLNKRLIQAPVDAIDYVITHELCHIEMPHHGPEFFELLNRVMPDWEKRKARLEKVMA